MMQPPVGSKIGPRPVQGDDGDKVLHAGGLGLGEQPLHPRGFQLEHAHRVPLGEHLEGGRVVLGQILGGEARLPAADELFGVVDNRQVPQAQEVHFQQAQLLNGGHGVLGDHGVVVFGQGHIVHHGLVGDDHPGIPPAPAAPGTA